MTAIAITRRMPSTDTLSGVWFVALFAMSAMFLAELPPFSSLGISPLILGIALGGVYGNTLRHRLPMEWVPGIHFSTRPLLRLAIVFYGFRLTFQQVMQVGLEGVAISATVVVSTLVIGTLLGIYFFKLDRDTAFLTSIGSSICGAAAVLAAEPVVKAEPHKSSMAVATVVIFGTITMFLYPVLFRAGLLGFDEQVYGMYVGGTIHEVAHAVAAGNAVSDYAGDTAVIVKMIRVLMIAPVLVVVSCLWNSRKDEADGEESGLSIPWFAVFFLVMVGVNSLGIVPEPVVELINRLDLFILTMAMCALGIETSVARLRKVGPAPIYLAAILCVWVIVGGYGITSLMSSIM